MLVVYDHDIAVFRRIQQVGHQQPILVVQRLTHGIALNGYRTNHICEQQDHDKY